jgi:hypothetical protein
LNNSDNQFLPLTNAVVKVLTEPEINWEAPRLAINERVVTMARAVKE